MKKISLSFLIIICLFSITNLYAATAVVKTDAFMYKGISEESEVINIVPKGAYVKLLFAKDQWAYIKFEDTKGNVKRDKLKVVPVKTVTVENNAGVMIYRSPSEDQKPIQSAPVGSSIDIFSADSDYYQVQYDGYYGWVVPSEIKPPTAPEEEVVEEAPVDIPESETGSLPEDTQPAAIEEEDSIQGADSLEVADEAMPRRSLEADYDTSLIDIGIDEEPRMIIPRADTAEDRDYDDELPEGYSTNDTLPYEYFPVRRDYDEEDMSRGADMDTGLQQVKPSDVFGGEGRSSYSEDTVSEPIYIDGIRIESVPSDDRDYGVYDPNKIPPAHTNDNNRYIDVPPSRIERPRGYTRAYSLYRSHFGVKLLAGSIFTKSIDFGDDFDDEALLYGVQTGTRISRSENGRFGSVLRAGFYFSYNSYTDEASSNEFTIEEFYYILPISFGASYDLSNDFAVTGGIGVAAVVHQKEFSMEGRDEWENLHDNTYLSPTAYAEIGYEITPFVFSIGGEYFMWNSDNTEYEIDNLGNYDPINGEIRRSLFGGFISVRLGF